MSNEDIVKDCLKKNIMPGRRTLVKLYGVNQYRAVKIADMLRGRIPIHETETMPKNGVKMLLPEEPIAIPMPVKKGLSIDQIRAKHDTHFIIAQAAARIEKDMFFTNSDFVAMCSFPGNSGYRDTLENSDFDKYKGKAGGMIYWGHPDSIKQLKTEGVLR
jgi:hypothetical protein